MYIKKSSEYKDSVILNIKYKKEGLTSKEAAKHLDIYGHNILHEKKKKSMIILFLSQFNDFIIWVLMGATLISGIMGEKADTITIAAIILLNGIMGFIQEYKTEKSMDALKKLTTPLVKVIRDAKENIIPSTEIVPDDIILLEAGDRIPADCVIIENNNFEVDEALLTGESLPVEKINCKILEKNIISYGKECCVYMGTVVTNGRAKAIVISTGMNTEMGKIADMIQNIQEEETPLQVRLEKMGKLMVFACIVACIIVTITGILKGEDIYVMFLTGVSLAVAAIPEGLPAIVTVCLTLGVQRMLKRNALIRKLPAVETLGCTNVICSDKTGTLTENKMTVKKIYCQEKIIDVEGNGYDINGQFLYKGNIYNIKNDSVLQLFLESSVVCNNAAIRIDDKKNGINTLGDPTEIALLIASAKANICREKIEFKYRRIDEIVFDSNRKRMSVIAKHNNEYYVFVKGAIDSILDLCSYNQYPGGVKSITQADKSIILKQNSEFAKDSLRVIAVAYKKVAVLPANINIHNIESNLIFLGLEGMIDPPRKEAIEAINICKTSGIKPVMITGDHKDTAIAVAKQLNILSKDSIVLTGSELDELSDKKLNELVDDVAVYARVTPFHKLRIVKAYKSRGHICAMTGDGVNDAPAVKEADIGVCMGKTGTDVTREASSMVILDDNFATIISAIEEGRIIYDNIRKFIRYLLSCNLGEVLTMFIASLIGIPMPLLPIQILMVNLVTDGLPAMALGVDPPDKDIMIRHPRSKNESIFSDGLGYKILLRGILIGLCTTGIFLLNIKYSSVGIIKARTMAFSTLVMSQLIHVFECRSEKYSIFEINLFSNIYLILSVVISMLMLCIVIYIPYFEPIFKTSILSFGDWVVVLFFSGAISLIVNLINYTKRR